MKFSYVKNISFISVSTCIHWVKSVQLAEPMLLTSTLLKGEMLADLASTYSLAFEEPLGNLLIVTTSNRK